MKRQYIKPFIDFFLEDNADLLTGSGDLSTKDAGDNEGDAPIVAESKFIFDSPAEEDNQAFVIDWDW